MNGVTHFFTGYLIARAMNYDSNRFEAFYAGLAAIVPDLDTFIGIFFPTFVHAEFSHTIIGGMVFELVFLFLSYALLRGFWQKDGVRLKDLMVLAVLGLASHLILDIFTLISPLWQGPCNDTMAHVYFWPLMSQSFHMDCLWPGMGPTQQLLAEGLYSAVLAAIILAYDWGFKKHNPILMFFPWKWWEHNLQNLPRSEMPKSPYVYLAILITIALITAIIPGP